MDINNLNLVKFEGAGGSYSRKVSITKAESFGFTETFLKENNLYIMSYVSVFYDVQSKVIGLKFSPDPDAGASFKLSFQESSKTSGGANVSARSFFKAYNLNLEMIKGRYDAIKQTLEPVGEIFLLDISKPSLGE